MDRVPTILCLALATLLAAPLRAEPPPIEMLAARSAVEGASLSPDGRYVAMLRTQAGKGVAAVFDRQTRKNTVLMGEPEGFRLRDCHWVSNKRLVCRLYGYSSDFGYAWGYTRMVGVDADGTNMRPLVQNDSHVRGQSLANVIAWRTADPETVLIQADSGNDDTYSGAVTFGAQGTYAVPSVFALDTRSDKVRVREPGHAPILDWAADPHGDVRLAWGLENTTETYYARRSGDKEWRRLQRFEVFTQSKGYVPFAISGTEPDKAYAVASHDGRDAIWMIDLADKADPQLLYSDLVADVSDAVEDAAGNVVGFRFDTDKPRVSYTDGDFAFVANAAASALGEQFVQVVGNSDDRTVFLVEAWSDRVPAHYVLYDRNARTFTSLGEAHAGLDTKSLAVQKPISFPSRDGKAVPGYLTLPAGGGEGKAPLIVMPHGGPMSRDTWGYDFLRHFLSTRGYAVLQVNFRGSTGYGWDWLHAAHQDWGGLSYDDVTDGVKWAVGQGIADPARVGIVGWSFGGYIAEVAAFRNPDLYKCSAAIAGVSDLSLLVDESWGSVGYRAVQQQIGTDKAKLKKDSPREHAAEFQVPLLMVHGDHDIQVSYDHSRLLDKALSRAGRKHKLVTIKDADHSLSHLESDRITMLRELEAFLGQNCPAR